MAEGTIIPGYYYDYYLITQYGVDLKSRKIYLSGGIEEGTVDIVVESIDYLNNKLHNPETYQDPIQIMINSPGGYLEFLDYLYDSMINSAAEIHTIGSGIICSAATLVLAAGDKRFATESSSFMAHKPNMELSGDDTTILSSVEDLKRSSQHYWKRLARHTNLTAGQWLSRVKRKGELWLDSQEMIQYGIIDEIIKPPRRILEPLEKRALKI